MIWLFLYNSVTVCLHFLHMALQEVLQHQNEIKLSTCKIVGIVLLVTLSEIILYPFFIFGFINYKFILKQLN